MNLLNLFEDDSRTPNPNYAEELAYQIFKVAPELDTTGAADEVLDYAFDLAVNDLGRKRAHSLFAYDEDFDSDLVNAYLDLQMNQKSVAEGLPKNDKDEFKRQALLVKDRKTGKLYDPNKEFDKKMKSPEVMAQMKRMAAKEGVAEGSEQVYNILALDKGNALKKPTKLKWKASSLEDIFDALAAQDWYPLEINGVEVIAGKRLKQGMAEDQLNEYLVKAGMPVKDVLALNLFQDFDPQEGAAAQFPEFAQEPMWKQVVRKYAPIANMLKKKLLAQKRPLTDAEAEAVEQTWYDGSDAYDDMEIEYLIDIYDQQIDTLEALLAGNLTDEEFLEQVVAEVDPQNFDSDEDYYDAVEADDLDLDKFGNGWDIPDEIAVLRNQLRHTTSQYARDQIENKIKRYEDIYYGEDDLEEGQVNEFQMPSVSQLFKPGQTQQATDDTPGNFSIVIAGTMPRDMQASNVKQAIETIFPNDYPRTNWPEEGSLNSPTHHLIQQLVQRGQAVAKDGISSKDVADSLAIKFKKFKVPAYVKGAMNEGTMVRKTDSKGRTQQQWIQAVYKKFPDARIVQAKMIDGPCHAMLADGRKISWTPVEQGVSEAKASTAAFRASNAKRAKLNAMSPEERKEYDKEQAEKQRKRDDARLEKERQKLAAKKKVSEADKKKDDAEPEIKDVVLQRAISRAKADFPTAGSGIEALAKDFMRSQEQDQKSLDQIRDIDQQQDRMLNQIDRIDQQQNDEIAGLEDQNSSLTKRLQQLQSVNNQLEKKLASMSGRKADKKSSANNASVAPSVPSVAPSATKTTEPITPKTKAKTKDKSQTTKSGMKSTAAQLAAPKADPMAAMTNRITKGDAAIINPKQAALPFEPSDNVLEPTIPQRQQDPRFAAARRDASDVDPRYGREIADKVKQQMTAQGRASVLYPDAERLKAMANQTLENNEQEANYDDKYQDMVARVGQKAREQEKSKPVDIKDLARRLAAIEASHKDK